MLLGVAALSITRAIDHVANRSCCLLLDEEARAAAGQFANQQFEAARVQFLPGDSKELCLKFLLRDGTPPVMLCRLRQHDADYRWQRPVAGFLPFGGGSHSFMNQL